MSRQSIAAIFVLMVTLLLMLGGCCGVDVYHTNTIDRLPQLEKRFANLKDKKLKKILLRLFMAQKIRVLVHDGKTKKVVIQRSFDLSPDLLLDSREYQLELASQTERHTQCRIKDEQNWTCDEYDATRLEMRDGQLYIAGIRLEKSISSSSNCQISDKRREPVSVPEPSRKATNRLVTLHSHCIRLNKTLAQLNWIKV
ncbi:MAG: hypothetical protein ACKO4M_07700, partial [Betaproteobacteria bacterium]